MTTLTLSVPQSGSPDATEEPKIASDLTAIQAWANGNIDASNISAAYTQMAGVNVGGGVLVKGVVVNVGPGTRTNTAYGALNDAADQVTGITVATNGLLRVWFQATWQESVDDAARAAIFIGANQFKVAQAGSAPVTEAATTGSGGLGGGINVPLSSAPFGLISTFPTVSGSSADVATGQGIGLFQAANPAPIVELGGSNVTIQANVNGAHQFLGGPCDIFGLPAGVYSISVQYKSSSGTVTASNRRLFVQSVAFS